MTYIVNENCIKCKYTDCVEVCPVDCFREAGEYLVIDPDDCIDCMACVPECPVDAIYADIDVPDNEVEWIEKNELEAPDLPIAEGDSPVLAEK